MIIYRCDFTYFPERIVSYTESRNGAKHDNKFNISLQKLEFMKFRFSFRRKFVGNNIFNAHLNRIEMRLVPNSLA